MANVKRNDCFPTSIYQFMHDFKENELEESWDKFLEEKDNALQEQSTEEVPVRDEPEASEGVREEDTETEETSE